MKRVCRRMCRCMCSARNPYQRWASQMLCMFKPLQYAQIIYMTPEMLRKAFGKVPFQ